MKKLESSFDTILNVDYDLYSVKLSELKILAKSWYNGVKFEDFDNRHMSRDNSEPNLVEMKKSGIISNLFYGYNEDGKYYLLDGFNRLFTEYGKIENDTTVYIKIITTKLLDNKLMETMYRLNMWKLFVSGFNYRGFSIHTYFDRGFKLLLHTKFGVDFYDYKKSGHDYYNRIRNTNDLEVIEYYFILEREEYADFKTTYEGVGILMSHDNVLNDIKGILKGNDYLTPQFKNYGMFLQGYAMYLAYLRYKGVTKAYEFEYFLNKLYENKSFFKKLKGMSGTDSTRKNIYKFYRNLNLEK